MQTTAIIKYLQMLQCGDEAGLRYFIIRFGDELRFFAFRITDSKEVAEEIVSEAFFKLWQRREKATSLAGVKSFLYIVTRNACYDHVGSAHQQRTVLEEETILDTVQLVPDILDQIIYTELIGQVIAELEKLPKQQAEIFRLSYLDGLETQEICEQLGTSASNVYFARSKALSRLRIAFKEKNISYYFLLVSVLW